MSQDQAIQLRSKIIGVLLRDARLAAGKSLKQVADVIGLSSGTLSAVERGANSLSLPELELLAFYLRIPIDHFWSEDIVSQDVSPADTMQAESLLALRHRTVAALLRQGRNQKNLSQKELSDRTNISPSRIRRYESGETPVPLPELEVLASTLGYALDDFVDSSGPVGQWITQTKASAQFDELPRDLQEFLSNPDNRYYVELAQRLSDIPVERLRGLVDTLNNIIN